MATRSAVERDGEILERANRRLWRAFRRLGSWRAVANELTINHGYLTLARAGKVPRNADVRRALGLPQVMPSERRERVKKVIPLMGSDGWQEVFFKRIRPRKFKR